MPVSLNFSIPSRRNCVPNIVSPLPPPPITNTELFFSKPPSTISSKPGIPLGILDIFIYVKPHSLIVQSLYPPFNCLYLNFFLKTLFFQFLQFNFNPSTFFLVRLLGNKFCFITLFQSCQLFF